MKGKTAARSAGGGGGVSGGGRQGAPPERQSVSEANTHGKQTTPKHHTRRPREQRRRRILTASACILIRPVGAPAPKRRGRRISGADRQGAERGRPRRNPQMPDFVAPYCARGCATAITQLTRGRGACARPGGRATIRLVDVNNQTLVCNYTSFQMLGTLSNDSRFHHVPKAQILVLLILQFRIPLYCCFGVTYHYTVGGVGS